MWKQYFAIHSSIPTMQPLWFPLFPRDLKDIRPQRDSARLWHQEVPTSLSFAETYVQLQNYDVSEEKPDCACEIQRSIVLLGTGGDESGLASKHCCCFRHCFNSNFCKWLCPKLSLKFWKPFADAAHRHVMGSFTHAAHAHNSISSCPWDYCAQSSQRN